MMTCPEHFIEKSLVMAWSLASAAFARLGPRMASSVPLTVSAISPADLSLWDPNTGPVYGDVVQHSISDCWLDATMAAVAYADQKTITKLMQDPHEPDGAVNVSLFDGNSSITTIVTKVMPNTTNMDFSDKHVTNSLMAKVWPAVMEVAFQRILASHSDMKKALDGGTVPQALQAIYGPGTQLEVIDLSDSTDSNDLWFLWNQVAVKPTTSSTRSSNQPLLANGLPANHTYTAMRCDRRSSVVTLRNPWGKVSRDPRSGTPTDGGEGITGRGDGVFDITFSDWLEYFVDMTVVI